MTTIVNTPTDRPDSGAGWAIAVILILVLVGGGFFLWSQYGAAPAQDDEMNINVTIPTGSGDAGAAQ